MLAHRKASQNLSENLYPSRLPLYKHHRPISPLECALPKSPATVHSKELTESAKSFRMRTYAKTGGRGPHPFPPSSPSFTRKETSGRGRPQNCRSNFFPNRNASTSSTFVPRIVRSTVRGFRSFLDVQTFRRANACLPQAGSDALVPAPQGLTAGSRIGSSQQPTPFMARLSGVG